MDSVTKSHTFNVPKIACFEEWLKNSKNDRNGALFAYISIMQDLSGIMEDSKKEIKTVIFRFSSKLSEKREGSRRTQERFLASNKEWLQGDLTLTVLYDHAEACCSSKESHPGPGRPTLNMEDASAKTKRRRVDDLIMTRSSEELLVVAEMSSRLSGKRNVAKLIKEVSESPDKLRDRIVSSDQQQKQQRCLTSDEVLVYYVISKSTSHSYRHPLINKSFN